MNTFKTHFLLILFLCTIQLSAKKIGIDISYAQFMNDSDEGYLEIYFALAGNSIDFAKINDGKYQGGVEVTVAVKQDSTFITADKFLLQSPELSDTSNFAEVYINQVRFPLGKGDYTLVLDIKDIHESSETYHFEQEFTIELGDAEPATSDLLFLDSYTPAKEGSIFAKSGYDLVPMVSSGSYYFNENLFLGLTLKYASVGLDNMDNAIFSSQLDHVQGIIATSPLTTIPLNRKNYLDSDLDLTGYYLTDNKDTLTKWQIPAQTISADGYSIFWADNDMAMLLSKNIKKCFFIIIIF